MFWEIFLQTAGLIFGILIIGTLIAKIFGGKST